MRRLSRRPEETVALSGKCVDAPRKLTGIVEGFTWRCILSYGGNEEATKRFSSALKYILTLQNRERREYLNLREK